VRQRTADALRVSEPFAMGVLNSLSAHIAILDDSGCILATNRAWRQFALDNPPVKVAVSEGANYLSVCEAAHGADEASARAFAAGIREVLKGRQQEFSLEYPCHSPDQERWFTGRVTRFAGEGRARAVVAHENITERKEAEVALRLGRAKWRSYVENAPVGVLVADETGRHVETNRAAEEILGYEPGGLLQTRIQDLPAPENGLALQRHFEEIATRGKSGGEFMLRRKDGSLVWTSMRAAKLADGRMIGIFLDITEQKKIAEALQRSEQNYREIFNAANEAIFLHDSTTGKVLDVNDSMVRLYGYDSKAAYLSGATYHAFVTRPPYTLEAALRRLRQAVEQGPQVFEWLAQKQDGEEFWVEVSLRNSQIGGQGRVLSVIRDITERKRAEVALRQSQERLNFALQASHTGAWSLNLLDRSATRTRIHAQIFGYATADGDWNLEKFLAHILPADRERTQRIIQEGTASKSDWSVECRIRRADGHVRWIFASGGHEHSSAGPQPRVSGIVQDITERKRAEAALRLSELKFARAFANNPAAIALTRLDDGLFLEVNDTWVALSGFSREEAIGRSARTMGVWPSAEAAARFICELRGQGMVRGWQQELRKKSGEVYLAELSAQTMTLDGEQLILSTYVDVTARRQAEAVLHELNRTLDQRVQERTAELRASNEELDAFVYAVSHDLRAPLRAMSGFSQALIEDFGGLLPPAARDFLDQIQLGSREMGGLIEGLLRLSRSTRGNLQREAVDLSALATRILRGLHLAEPQRVVACTVEPGLTASGDARLLEVVLANLLGNAWKYTAKTPQPIIRVQGQTNARTPTISVTDNGAGFDQKHAAKLFQPFQRLHREEEFPGIGIGLATVQRIIRRHGGSIQATGAPGAGATFTFSLP
jgi:PAS domain S-box-containing protein